MKRIIWFLISSAFLLSAWGPAGCPEIALAKTDKNKPMEIWIYRDRSMPRCNAGPVTTGDLWDELSSKPNAIGLDNYIHFIEVRK